MFLKLADAVIVGASRMNATWVNMDKVTSFCRVASENQTAIFLDGDENPLLVVESPERIVEMMNAMSSSCDGES